ncbi:MAG TPA: lasso peptide biosynthesis B2 protein [Terriglobales bacterium]|nr:lasso peptide biosynthesis B2 protein [Terriglobales bacterium]
MSTSRPILLTRHVHLSLSEEFATFLDLKRDRYFTLGPPHISLLRAIIKAPYAHDQSTAGFISELTREGLFTISRENGKPLAPAQILMPNHTLLDGFKPGDLIPISEMPRMLRAYVVATGRLRLRTLAALVECVRRRKQIDKPTRVALDPGRAKTAFFTFLRLRPLLYRQRRNCLLDSLVLFEYLASHGIFVDLVFGVRYQPFAAHSWVQYGRSSLNGRPEFLAAFRPILIV